MMTETKLRNSFECLSEPKRREKSNTKKDQNWAPPDVTQYANPQNIYDFSKMSDNLVIDETPHDPIESTEFDPPQPNKYVYSPEFLLQLYSDMLEPDEELKSFEDLYVSKPIPPVAKDPEQIEEFNQVGSSQPFQKSFLRSVHVINNCYNSWNILFQQHSVKLIFFSGFTR
jgi:hypothetical protein